MTNKLLRILLFTLIFLLIFQYFSPKGEKTQLEGIAYSGKDKFPIGKEVSFTLENHTDQPVVISNNCPNNPLTVEKYLNGEWIVKESVIDESLCNESLAITLEPQEKSLIHFGKWSYDLFNEEGKYRVLLPTTIDETEKLYSYEVEISSASMFRKFWVEVFYRPILNVLIYVISILPYHSLGWGIIILTLFIKLLLLGPNHKALKAQKQMQKIQPQLEALKIKHKDNPQLLASETMAIWKKYKVSPMSSCLPMLIQFPILIALFWVVKDGMDVINPALLYGNLSDFSFASVNPVFLSIIDLTKINFIVLPIVVGGLQFFQMKLSFAKINTNLPKSKKGGPDPLPMMNKMMQYMMPAMIAVFTATMPAAVGFYWGTSTLFGIGQQVIVNRSKD